MMTVLLVDLGLIAGAGSTAVAAGAMRVKRTQHRPPRPDYELIADMEREDTLWRRREAIGGRSPREIHLEMDDLWRQLQTDDSSEIRERLNELVAEYRQALADEQGGEE